MVTFTDPDPADGATLTAGTGPTFGGIIWGVAGADPPPTGYVEFVGGLHGSLVQGIESVVGSAQDALSGMANVTAAAVPAVGGVVAGIGRGTPEQVAAIYKGITNGTIGDWAADYSRGYLGAATYMNGPSGSMQQQPSTVPGYVTAWAGNTASMPTPASQITVNIQAIDAQSFEEFARRNRVQFAGTILSAIQANGLAMS